MAPDEIFLDLARLLADALLSVVHQSVAAGEGKYIKASS
jgi:hypothetical protein